LIPPSSVQLAFEILHSLPGGLISGLKVETEGEGAPWQRVSRLAVFAARSGFPLTLKIGGPDARTDLLRASEIGIAGITAPLVETPFAVWKFRAALDSTAGAVEFQERNVLLESAQGIRDYEEIIGEAQNFASGINIGRSDLRRSMTMRDPKAPGLDSKEFLSALVPVVQHAASCGLVSTLGGSVTENSVRALVANDLGNLLDRVETRRFVIHWAALREEPALIRRVLEVEEALGSEELQRITLLHSKEAARVADLRARLGA